ncbi:hypothetical protein ACVWW6_006013 [Bradyrhizobium sp. USDA 3311]
MSSALLLTACQSGNSLATFGAGDGRLTVDLPAVCEAFLQPVPQPQVSRKTDGRVAYTRAADALDEANSRIENAAECHRDERAAYGAGKDKPK